MSQPVGLMRLEAEAFNGLVADVLTALRIKNPTWLRCFDEEAQPSYVQMTLFDLERLARESAATSTEGWGYGSTGGIKLVYTVEDGCTEVWVQLATIYDEDEPTGVPQDGE